MKKLLALTVGHGQIMLQKNWEVSPFQLAFIVSEGARQTMGEESSIVLCVS